MPGEDDKLVPYRSLIASSNHSQLSAWEKSISQVAPPINPRLHLRVFFTSVVPARPRDKGAAKYREPIPLVWSWVPGDLSFILDFVGILISGAT